MFSAFSLIEFQRKKRSFLRKTVRMRKITTWNGGHSESVLSLDVNSSGILVSGGEEYLCVWTTEGVPLTKVNPPNTDSSEITSVCFCRQKPDRLFVSSGTKVFNYDLRSLDSPVCEFNFNEDEINQLAIHDGGQYLAACDDTGAVKVIDTRQNKLFKTLSRSHGNICSTVQFRPRRPWDLVTGGMDYKVVYWDFSSGRVLQDIDMQQEVESGAYFLNPPFVHSVHVKENSRNFAAGLGDGSIQLFHFEGRKQFVVDQKIKGHTQGVSQVHFPNFKHSENILISGGNDEKLILWNLSKEQNSQSANGNDGTALDEGTDSLGFSINCTIQHGSKVNWMTSYSMSKNLLFVADQTNQISVYEALS